MYETYWKLSARPFADRGAPERFFCGQTHQSALLRLGYGLLNLNGPAVVLGPSGVGKSSLVKLFAKEHPKFKPFVHLVFATLAPDAMLRCLCAELTGVIPDSSSGDEVSWSQIRDTLRKSTSAGLQTLIAFDDAHQLSDDVLMQIVLPLLTLTESDSQISASLLLSGQPVLASQLRRLRPLAERVAVTTPITGWNRDETSAYVARCLTDAGGRSEIFTPGAVQKLFEVSGGNPRRINRLADMALVVGFADAMTEVSDSLIESIATELLAAA